MHRMFALMLVLVPVLGLNGAALGSMMSIIFVSVPANVIALVREEGSSPRAFFAPILPWLFRFLSIIGAVTVLLYFWTPVGPWQFVPMAIAVAGLYVLLMVPVMMTPPLGPLLAARLHPWLSRLPRVARHLARPVDALAR